jgi:hypothetical protein
MQHGLDSIVRYTDRRYTSLHRGPNCLYYCSFTLQFCTTSARFSNCRDAHGEITCRNTRNKVTNQIALVIWKPWVGGRWMWMRRDCESNYSSWTNSREGQPDLTCALQESHFGVRFPWRLSHNARTQSVLFALSQISLSHWALPFTKYTGSRSKPLLPAKTWFVARIFFASNGVLPTAARLEFFCLG